MGTTVLTTAPSSTASIGCGPGRTRATASRFSSGPTCRVVAPAAQGPDFFEVWTKDGRKLTYGRTRDSLLIARNGVRNAWLLSRVEDRSGNSMIIRYNNASVQLPPQLADKSGILIEPQAIFYTGHAGVGGDREVRFDYDLRVDPSVSYAQGGLPVVNARRLKRITTFVKGTAVKHYRLKYDLEQSRLVSQIRECSHNAPDQDESPCKPPTVFDYVKESGFTDHNLNFGSNVSNVGQLDMNGDGLPDFLIITAHVGPTPQLGVGGKLAYIVVDVGLLALSHSMPLAGLPATVVWTLIKDPLQGVLAGSPAITFTGDVRRVPECGTRPLPGCPILAVYPVSREPRSSWTMTKMAKTTSSAHAAPTQFSSLALSGTVTSRPRETSRPGNFPTWTPTLVRGRSCTT